MLISPVFDMVAGIMHCTFLALAAAGLLALVQNTAAQAQLKYPAAPTSNQVDDYNERFGVPFKEGGRYFFSKNTGLENQNVIYTTTNFSEAPRELLDPNLLAKDGTDLM